MAKRILVRADDVGYCRGVNYGIADSVWNGIIGSVGVMPNMPETQHGVDLLKGSGVCFGMHTNVCLGKPCADPAKIPSLLDENGDLKSSRTNRDAGQKGEEIVSLDEMVIEIEAQYQRYLELTGEKPHYFEAHAVLNQNLARGLEIVAEKYDLPYLPACFEPTGVQFKNTVLITRMESMKPDYDPAESLKKAVLAAYKDNECPMFVCHPGYIDDYLMNHSSLVTPRPKEVAMLTDPAIRNWLEEQNVQLVTYDEM
mgnify:FL=1